MNCLDLLPELAALNRTLVSRDAETVLDRVGRHLPLTIHRYPSGTEHQGWPVPPEWNVIKGELRDGARVIASYEECPLFVAPYSAPYQGSVSYDELTQHTFTKPEHPTAFNYEHRVAADHRRRLEEWRIALPYERLMSLDKDKQYEVEIRVEAKPGHMLIGEHVLAGQSSHNFYFLAHYCHPAQINDGLAGVVTGMEFMNRLRARHPNPHFTYRLLILPETFGSAVYAANHLDDLDEAIGAAFTEMPGAAGDLQFVHSRRGDTYIDRIFRHVLQTHGKPVRLRRFRGGWGNDELMFDSAGLGVPAISLDRFPFPQYHTHADDMSNFHCDKFEEMVELFLAAVDIIESDFIPRPVNRLPVYLTRHGLYADWTWERARYDSYQKLIDNFFSGRSIVDIALEHGLDAAVALEYAKKFVQLELLESEHVEPAYARDVRFLPDFVKT